MVNLHLFLVQEFKNTISIMVEKFLNFSGSVKNSVVMSNKCVSVVECLAIMVAKIDLVLLLRIDAESGG